ncbi:hypothetical protein DFH09DRAFT_1132144, partial [Mycena vulgaris]
MFWLWLWPGFMALAWLWLPKIQARPKAKPSQRLALAWKPRSHGFLAGINGNFWLWPAKIPGHAKANAVWSRPKPKPSQKAMAFWPEAKARTSLALPARPASSRFAFAASTH